MKRINICFVQIAIISLIFVSCDFLDTKIDTITTPERVETSYGTLWNFANSMYAPLQYGFWTIDDNLFASASDEAQQTSVVSGVSYFNKGTINASVNPLSSLYQNYYDGIRAAYFFLDYAKDGENFLALNRDTSAMRNPVNRVNYRRDVLRLDWYRAEAYIAMAYYYSELIKMYGGVPIVTSLMENDPNKGRIQKLSYDDCVEHIVNLIDEYVDQVNPNWNIRISSLSNWDVSDQAGRFDKATALAIKARTLLYAASPRNNPNNDKAKWERAAQAAHELIVFKNYTIPANRNYNTYFQGTGALNNSESIYFIRKYVMNSPEVRNYPISTPGGNSGITPTHNLVSAYEYIGAEDTDNPYANRDPRLAATIVVNGSNWNDRIIDQSPGGFDDMAQANTSRTGYYLKKFLTDNLNLTQSAEAQHLWPVYRYSEVLLNYAEAMNEIYGTDEIPMGFTLSAQQALRQVRRAASTNLPEVTTVDRIEFRDAVKHERRIELAFEDHRYWDLIRWKDAETVLNKPVTGVKVISKDEILIGVDDEENELYTYVYNYQVVDVAPRVFRPHHYYLPFSRAEVENSKGTLQQNDGYN